MKALRKSLNANKDTSHHHQISTPLPPVSKPSAAIIPPQKVIRATSPYRSQAPQELSFQKGDFFYVIREVNEQGTWYEAHNPASGARGLVPRALFEEFKKGAATTRSSQSLSFSSDRPPSMRSPKSQAFYAVVMHDFVAERADELDAKAGDSISVVAQSNREWFVAKPIGKLGKPGLIPVSFVEIRDPATNKRIENLDALMDNGSLPRVEEWKKQMLSYKASSIPLGTLDSSPNTSPVADSTFSPKAQSIPLTPAGAARPPTISVQQPSTHPYQTPHPPAEQTPPPSSPKVLPPGLLLSASVVSFHFETDEYWFRIHAMYQPYDLNDTTSLPPARDLVLFRAYNDFFDYQSSVIELFPREAGRQEPYPRIIPYMPGPADTVDDKLTAARREELDDYLRHLTRLNRTTGRYILEAELTRQFLSVKPGDVENAIDPQFDMMDEMNWYEPVEEPDKVPPLSVVEEIESSRLSSIHVNSSGHNHTSSRATNGRRRESDGSDYGEDARRPANGHQRQTSPANGHQRQASRANGHRTQPSQQSSYSRGPSPDDRVRGHAPPPSYPANLTALDTDPYRTSSYSRSSTSSVSRWPEQHSYSSHNTQATSPSSHQSRSSVADSAPARSRSQSLASPNPISAQNPQTAFIKIKIFDRVSDDLIAIRVHPRVTHEQLVGKVQERLGGKVGALSYRESVGGAEDFVPLEQDQDLRIWLESTDKHVLYAD